MGSRMTGETLLLSCPEGQCPVVNLTVVETGTGGNPKCEIKVVANLDMRANPTGTKTLTWVISSGDYEFSEEKYRYGIFVQDDDDPIRRVKGVAIQGGGKRLVLQFEHRQGTFAKEYKYALTVKRPGNDGQFCKTLDPWIIS